MKSPKHIPYGSKKGLFWCSYCDAGHTNSLSSKSERQKAKKDIEKQMDETNEEK